MLYAAVAQEGSDPSVTPRGEGAGEEARRIPSNTAATRQQQALGDAPHPETAGQRHSPLAHGVSPRAGCKQSDGGDRPSAAGKNGVIRSAAPHCPFCGVFSGDYHLMFTSLFGFKVSLLQVSFLMCRETEKCELKTLKNLEMKKEISWCLSNCHGFRQLALQRMRVPLCTGAGLGAGGC